MKMFDDTKQTTVTEHDRSIAVGLVVFVIATKVAAAATANEIAFIQMNDALMPNHDNTKRMCLCFYSLPYY